MNMFSLNDNVSELQKNWIYAGSQDDKVPGSALIDNLEPCQYRRSHGSNKGNASSRALPRDSGRL